MTFDAKRFLATVTNSPGVYIMRDADQEVLYIGKARNLKNRLSSYFRSRNLAPKTAALVSHVADVQTTVTQHESEALLLENNLIKEHRPRYNVMYRDDKSYPYIHLTDDHPFPRLGFYRGARKEPGRYFGPYPSAGSVRETLAQIQKVFPIRQCEDTFYRNRSRPCLQYQIKRCTAPCVGYVEEARYREDVEQAVLFLQGKNEALWASLTEKMEQAAERLDFESAAMYRDRIGALRRVQQRQYVDSGGGDADVIAVATVPGEACIELVFIRSGRNIGSRHYFTQINKEETHEEILSAFVSQYYLGKPIPSEIIVGHALDEQALLERAFTKQTNHNVRFRTRVRGHRARWLQMATLNATDALRRHQAGKASRKRRMDALQEALSLDNVPQRLECFDISHTMGEKTVASCVVFDINGAVKSDYRRFNIEGITGGDDYGAMTQVLTRRYKRAQAEEAKLPDVIFIDGGKGQLGTAIKVMEELGIDDVTLVGVAKGTTRKAGLETLLIHGRSRALHLRADSPALHLIQEIRDEAHRFAITGHRQRRGKARTTSTLEAIPGVGDKRRQALLKHFGGLKGIANAGVDDLVKIPGISPALAERIHAEFNDVS